MKKIKNFKKIQFLKEEYEKTLQELKEIQEFYSLYAGNFMNFSSILNRVKNGTLNAKDEQLFCELLECNRRLFELETRIKRLEAIEEYKKQVDKSHFAYTTQQELRMMMDDGDASVKCFERFIPDEVETGYFATEEDRIIAEQTHACYKMFKTQQDEDEAIDIINKSVEKYATYIPDEVETGYIPIEVEEKHGIKMVQLNRGPVEKDWPKIIVGKITNAQLTNAEVNRRDRMDQNSRRRASGAEGFNGRYGQ
ncbi:MAG: hypothetical protein IKX00_03025 [Bacilli bacterium]|nr:hypothetical protein [Bacilli bacterium]